MTYKNLVLTLPVHQIAIMDSLIEMLPEINAAFDGAITEGEVLLQSDGLFTELFKNMLGSLQVMFKLSDAVAFITQYAKDNDMIELLVY